MPAPAALLDAGADPTRWHAEGDMMHTTASQAFQPLAIARDLRRAGGTIPEEVRQGRA